MTEPIKQPEEPLTTPPPEVEATPSPTDQTIKSVGKEALSTPPSPKPADLVSRSVKRKPPLTVEKAKALFEAHKEELQKVKASKADLRSNRRIIEGHKFRLVKGEWYAKVAHIGQGAVKNAFKYVHVTKGEKVAFLKPIIKPRELEAKKAEKASIEKQYPKITARTQKEGPQAPKEVQERYKALSNEIEHIESDLALLKSEAEILFLLKGQRGVVDTHTFEDYESGQVAFIQNLEEAGELYDFLIEASEKDQPLEDRFPDSINEAVFDLLYGLVAIHREEVAHNDLKPENILATITADNRLQLKISDFGISTKGKTDKLFGTPFYFTPTKWHAYFERGKKHEAYDTRPEDVYTLGTILLEIISDERGAVLSYMLSLDQQDRLEDTSLEAVDSYAADRVIDPDSFFHLDPDLPEEEILKKTLAKIEEERGKFDQIKKLEEEIAQLIKERDAIGAESDRLRALGKGYQADDVYIEADEKHGLAEEKKEQIKRILDPIQLFDDKGEFKRFKALTNHVIWTMLDPDPETRPTSEQTLAAFVKAVNLQEKINAQIKILSSTQ